MSDRNNDQELEKTTDATADEVTSETETNDAIESVPADSMQFSVTFDDVDDEGTVDDGIYSALASAETGETDETSEAEADAIASANASAEVTERNAARVNETLRLAKTDHKDALAEHAEPQGKAAEPTMTLASRIDRVLVGGGSDDILLKTYPTFALNKVTVAGPKGKVNILDGANFFCYSGHAYALLISDDPDSGITADAKRRALMGVMSGLATPVSGTVMNKSANIVELEPVELRGHRLGHRTAAARRAAEARRRTKRAVRHGCVQPQLPEAQAGDRPRTAGQGRLLRGHQRRGRRHIAFGAAAFGGHRPCNQHRGRGADPRRADTRAERG